MQLKKISLILCNLWTIISLCQQSLPALASSAWTELYPTGSHFSVHIPKISEPAISSENGLRTRTWKSTSGDASFKVISMYSPEIDSSYADTFLATIVDKEHSKHRQFTRNGYKFEEITVQRTDKHAAERRWFYIEPHHAALFSESASDLPKEDDEFFKSIKITGNEDEPKAIIKHEKSGASFLFPVEYEGNSQDAFWKAKDPDHDYLVQIEHSDFDRSNAEQLEAINNFFEQAKGKEHVVIDEFKKIQGLNTRRFAFNGNTYLVMVSPKWSYIFLCMIQDQEPSTQKGMRDFFDSIKIHSPKN